MFLRSFVATAAMVSSPPLPVTGIDVSLGDGGTEAGLSWVVGNGKGLFGPPPSKLPCILRKEP